jgi:hypothetical protein
MIHKAKAMCPNGHMVEFGACNKEITKFFFLKSVCTSTDHEVISRYEIQCQRCNTIHVARVCPKCEQPVPVVRFGLKTQMERLKR